MLHSNTKALSQFLKKGVANEDIVLKSKGTQEYSYVYVADAVSGLLYSLLYGSKGEAYNVADASSDISLAHLAQMIANLVGRKVVFDIPDAVEQAGYSKATKAMLNSDKIRKLEWKSKFSLLEGIEHTISILRKLS